MIIDSPIISGSTSATGSLNQVGNVTITGSLTVTGAIIGAVTGSVDSASFSQTAISSSYAASATSASYAVSATSSSYAQTASYAVDYLLLSTYSSSVSGTVNYVPKFTTSNILGNSSIFDNGNCVGIGTASPSFKLDVNGDGSFNGVRIGRGGGNESTNTALGSLALRDNTTGYSNLAIGYWALIFNTTGRTNTAIGNLALAGNFGGYSNVALGESAGQWICASGTCRNETGYDSIFIGNSTRAGGSGQNNQIVIGSNAVGNGSNTVTIGNTNITKTVLRGGVEATSFTGSLQGTASYAANANLLDGLDSTVFVPTGSFNTFSSSILTYTGSNDTNISNIHSTTASLNTASGSAITRLSSLESKTGSYATTGSNTFVDGQYISASFNPTGFTTTASLYTDGGLRVGRDAYISGTLYLNNVTVYGTQSISYISSSQLNIGTNIISVNTDTPSVRFGGLAVYDSGSTGLTGSILWDSQDNQWIYSNPSGSAYDSAMFLVGPRNSGTLGNEVGIECNFLSKGNGMHHMTSSAIFDDGSRTCFYGTSIITSTGVGCFSGAVCASSIASAGTINGTTVYGSTAICGGVVCGTNATFNGVLNVNPGAVLSRINLGYNFCIENDQSPEITSFINSSGTSIFRWMQGASPVETMRLSNLGYLGIGAVSPVTNLHICNSTNTGLRIQAAGSNGSSELDLLSHGTQNAFIDFGPNQLRFRSTNCDMTVINDGNVLVLNNNGCVGVNTTSPRSILHVQQATNDGVPAVGCARDGLIISSNNGNYGLNIGVDPTGPTWIESMRFDDGATAYNLLLQAAGRCSVLIGTGTALAGCRQQLVIGGNSFGSLIALGNNGNGNKFVIESDSSENVLINNKSNTPMIFYTCNTRRFDITNTGIACFACQVCSSGIVSSGCITGVGESTYIGTDAQAVPRLGFMKKPGAQPFLVYAQDPFILASSSGTTIDPANTFTSRLSISTTGIATFACQVCSPAFIGGVVSGTTLCTSNGIIGNNSNNLYLSSNSAAGEISFWGNQLSTRLMTILGNGCVSIGACSAPGAQLVVYGTCNGDTTLHVQNGSVSGKITFSNNTANAIYGGGWWGYMGYSSATYHNFAQCVYAPSFALPSSGCIFYCTGAGYNGIIKLWDSTNGNMVFQNVSGGTSDIVFLPQGKVGIGTATPSYKLSIVHSGVGEAISSFQNTSSTGYSGAHILNNSGTLMGHWGYGNASISGGLSDLVYFGSIASKAVVFTTNDIERVRITAAGIACFSNTVCSPSFISSGVSRVDSLILTRGTDAQICSTVNVGLNIDGFALYLNRYSNSSIVAGGSIVPLCNGNQDLGSANCRWCTVYTSDLSLNNGIGNYTIVEGENDLFLYNNNSCKVYKFVVQEVCPEIAPAKRSI